MKEKKVSSDDPVSPQGRVEMKFGRTPLVIETPTDLDALLEDCIKVNPKELDKIPYYALLWPSAQGLAKYIHTKRAKLPGLRMIELGCGLALPSVLAAKHGADVVATDFHPGTGPWVRKNARLNDTVVGFKVYDWNDSFEGKAKVKPAEVVFGSDLLYDRRHMPALICTIDKFTAPGGEAWIADPGRNGLEIFVSGMEKIDWTCELVPVDDIFVMRCRRNKKPRR